MSLDSIAVSLFGWSKQIQFKSSTNSIRRQDPNTYSDTEMRALSMCPWCVKYEQTNGQMFSMKHHHESNRFSWDICTWSYKAFLFLAHISYQVTHTKNMFLLEQAITMGKWTKVSLKVGRPICWKLDSRGSGAGFTLTVVCPRSNLRAEIFHQVSCLRQWHTMAITMKAGKQVFFRW